jgi:hypothetical protein
MHHAPGNARRHEGDEGEHPDAAFGAGREHACRDDERQMVEPDDRMADSGRKALPERRRDGAAHRMMRESGGGRAASRGGADGREQTEGAERHGSVPVRWHTGMLDAGRSDGKGTIERACAGADMGCAAQVRYRIFEGTSRGRPESQEGA